MQSALSFARAPAAGARTLAAAHRPRARHMVAAARPITTKAQADDKAGAAEGGAADVPAAPSQEQQHAVAPRAPTGLLGMSAAPSWGRMNQVGACCCALVVWGPVGGSAAAGLTMLPGAPA